MAVHNDPELGYIQEITDQPTPSLDVIRPPEALSSRSSFGSYGKDLRDSSAVNDDSTSHQEISRSTGTAQRYVKWGIARQPLWFMIAFGLSGVILAIGHHIYYASLHSTVAGSPSRQQFAIRFGNVFSFLVTSLLAASIGAAYDQYLWTLFKRKSFSVGGIDDLFSLKSVLTGFLNLELYSHAKVAVFLAACSWLVVLAAITPPATLAVVTGSYITSLPTLLPSLNWTSPEFYIEVNYIPAPSTEVLGIAERTAGNMAVLPITPPAANCSFNLQFYGPSIQCSKANITEQAIFNNYSMSSYNYTNYDFITTRYQVATMPILLDLSNISSPFEVEMQLFSAFAPYEGDNGWFMRTGKTSDLDAYNNWEHLFGDSFSTFSLVVQQLWVQTSEEYFVCSLGNSSYEVEFDIEDGVQTVVRSQNSEFDPLWLPRSAIGVSCDISWPLMATFIAFTSLLSGNISMTVDLPDPKVVLSESSSRIGATGLDACDEFKNNF
ncbi:hypothetical protein EAF04_009716 [Stromatinia cepivora]|nr:hypothetical protein EAF04_009716 [Stromatinia cepivora]